VDAIQKIRDEHRTMSAVLLGLKELARDAQNARVKPDFAVFRAMIRYIDQFPEAVHHPKEDRYLLEPLAVRAPETRALVESLRREHNKGTRLVRELERALIFFEDGWPAGGADFRGTIDAYADFHWNHMRIEEQQVLPAAQRHFTPSDWEAIDRAFAVNRDPLAGIREKDFRRLFTRIVTLAPEPVGLGERWS